MGGGERDVFLGRISLHGQKVLCLYVLKTLDCRRGLTMDGFGFFGGF